MALEIEETTPAEFNEYVEIPSMDSGLACETCGIPLVYSGRGRKPKFCNEHKKQTSSNTSEPRTSRKGNSTDVLIANINDLYLTAGTALTMAKGTAYDGMVIAQNASQLAESWRGLIDRDPKIRKFWEKAFTATGYGALIAAHMVVAIPILQHHKLIPNAKESV
jgi:hypothetical protein